MRWPWTTKPSPPQGQARPITPDLIRYEAKISSQFGEDGVVARLAADLGIEKGSFFEFGIGPADGRSYDKGLEGNFVQLRRAGWTGVFLDGTPDMPDDAGVHREFITALNINALYTKYNLPVDLDFLSIDVDGQEFWIWLALAPRPKVVLIEYNGGLGPDVSVMTQFNVDHLWDGTVYHSASLRAFDKLAASKGYVLVWANGVNAAFVRGDLMANPGNFTFDRLWRGFEPHRPDPLARPWVPV